MYVNIINATIALFSLFFGFILGLIYGWFQGLKDSERLNNDKR